MKPVWKFNNERWFGRIELDLLRQRNWFNSDDPPWQKGQWQDWGQDPLSLETGDEDEDWGLDGALSDLGEVDMAEDDREHRF